MSSRGNRGANSAIVKSVASAKQGRLIQGGYAISNSWLGHSLGGCVCRVDWISRRLIGRKIDVCYARNVPGRLGLVVARRARRTVTYTRHLKYRAVIVTCLNCNALSRQTRLDGKSTEQGTWGTSKSGWHSASCAVQPRKRISGPTPANCQLV